MGGGLWAGVDASPGEARGLVAVVGAESMLSRGVLGLLRAQGYSAEVREPGPPAWGGSAACLVDGWVEPMVAGLAAPARAELVFLLPSEREVEIPRLLRAGAFATLRRSAATLEEVAHTLSLAVERHGCKIAHRLAPAGPVVRPEWLRLPFTEAKARFLEAFEEAYVGGVLDATGGNISEAARRARLDRSNFRRLVGRLRSAPRRGC